MAQAVLAVTVQCGGISIQKTVTRTGDSATGLEPTLPSAKAVTAWVKTDANTAACNLPADHGYSNGNFDVYWTTAGVQYLRYDVPGTISTNALSLDGGTGDDFPASATSGVTVCRQVQVNVALDGDAAKVVGMAMEFTDQTSTAAGHVSFKDAAADEIMAKTLYANTPYTWDITGGATNSFTGDPITVCYASNSSSTADAVLKLAILSDSTP